MKLIKNWRDILKHAWSVRLLYLAAMLSGIEVALPLLGTDAMPFSKWCFALINLLIVAAAFVARIVAQRQFGSAE